MAHLHNVIQPRWILGLTAVPFRTDRLKLCFDKVIRDAGIHALIEEGYLSQYEHFTIPEFSVETVAEFYLREPNRWGKSIVFFRTLRECHRFRDLLVAGGVVCEVVSASTDREQQLEAFQTDSVPILANCMILTEGFDCPNLQTVFCRDSSKGPTVQMCGRVLRRHPGLAVKNIVQSKLTRWPFTRVARPVQHWLWQADEWRSLNINPLIDVVTAQARVALANSRVELPKLLKRHRANGDLPAFMRQEIDPRVDAAN
jgi:superfamily II DNA or RNA helicase